MPAKKKTTKKKTTAKRKPATKKKTTRRKPRAAGFSMDATSLVMAIAGAAVVPMILEKLPVIVKNDPVKDRQLKSAGIAFLCLVGSKKVPKFVPFMVGAGVAAGTMLAADLFPKMFPALGASTAGGTKTIGRLTKAEEDRVYSAVQQRIGQRPMRGMILGPRGRILGYGRNRRRTFT